jgi:MFS family permease
MVGADLLRLGSQGAMAVLVLAGAAEVWHLAALAAVHGAGTALFNPATSGLTAEVVPRDDLQQANGIRALVRAAGDTGGPAIAGVIVAAAGAGWALAADALTFAVSAGLLLWMPMPERIARVATPSFLTDLRDGWREFTARSWVWGTVAVSAFANLPIGAMWVLGPVVAARDLGGAAAWGALLAAFGAGAFAGGVAVLRVSPRRPLVLGAIACAPCGLPIALLAAAAPVVVLMPVMVVAGAGIMMFNTLWETTLQRHIPLESLSRVSAYDWFGSLALDPVGRAVVGPIAVAVGVSTTLWAAAAVYAALTVAQVAFAVGGRTEG